MEKELEFYEKIGNWDFSMISYHEEIIKDEFDYFKWIEKYTNEECVCLDLGTGGGEKVLNFYPKVKKIIGIDLSSQMIKTARENLEKSTRKNEEISFLQMDINNLKFDDNTFDVITARHTILNVNEIKRVLKPNGILIIEGVAKDDSYELKEMVGRGQCFFDETSIEEIEFQELENAGFRFLENKMMLLNEWYHSKNDFMSLLFKTPIIEKITEKDLIKIEEYVSKNTNLGNIKLVRRIYGFVCQNIK